jgi:beta-glucosidase
MFQICNSFNAKHEYDDLWCNDSTSINLAQNNIFEFDPLEVHRLNFPDGFVFGTASAAYQVEGAAKERGRSSSIWDKFSHIPGNIVKNATGDITADQFHRFKEDIQIMKNLNMDAYCFSISWSRLIPDGRGPVNWSGVEYYNFAH